MKALQTICSVCLAGLTVTARAEVAVIVSQGEEQDLAATYSSTDLIQNLIAIELPGDRGWHSANTGPLDQLPAFTDGEGMLPSGLTGLLNDFPGAESPAKLIKYELSPPSDIGEIRIFTGNNGRDGRVFHTYTVRFSSDGVTFTEPVYVQSHLSGTLNNAQENQWRVVLSQLTDTAGPLATSVTHIEFAFYSVDNTGGQMRDAFDGLNTFTGTDDGLSAAFVSPLVWEIDVFPPESLPRLSATVSQDNLNLTWDSNVGGNFVIESTSELALPHWAEVDPQPVIQTDGTTRTASIPISGLLRFFRLRVVP